jgi:hypothetical protein
MRIFRKDEAEVFALERRKAIVLGEAGIEPARPAVKEFGDREILLNELMKQPGVFLVEEGAELGSELGKALK